MDQIVTTRSIVDAELAQQWTRESKSSMLKNYAFSGAVVALAAGVGIAAVVWATKQGTDPEVLRQALANMPTLKVDGTVRADGKVTMDHGTVRLADGGVVRLTEGGVVRLAEGGVVRLADGSVVKGPVPPVTTTPLLTVPMGDPAIPTTVTVFKTVAWREGTSIVTGWKFASGSAKAPFKQYCYWHREDPDIPGAWVQENLAEDQIALPSAQKRFPRNFEEMGSKCTWFKGLV